MNNRMVFLDTGAKKIAGYCNQIFKETTVSISQKSNNIPPPFVYLRIYNKQWGIIAVPIVRLNWFAWGAVCHVRCAVLEGAVDPIIFLEGVVPDTWWRFCETKKFNKVWDT